MVFRIFGFRGEEFPDRVVRLVAEPCIRIYIEYVIFWNIYFIFIDAFNEDENEEPDSIPDSDDDEIKEAQLTPAIEENERSSESTPVPEVTEESDEHSQNLPIISEERTEIQNGPENSEVNGSPKNPSQGYKKPDLILLKNFSLITSFYKF